MTDEDAGPAGDAAPNGDGARPTASGEVRFDPRGGWRRVAAVAALALVPWTVVAYGGEFDLVFAWGLANTNPPTVTDLYAYLFTHTLGPRSLPGRLLAWPVGTAIYASALASAGVGARFGREDPRVTAGLLACAAVANLRFTVGIDSPGSTALPIGAVALLGVVWWFYWPPLSARQGSLLGR